MTSKNLHLITGQFGDVYTAEMNRSTVAVKVIKRFSSKRVKEQFENEMTIMSQVSHNNVVRLHGIIRNGERKIIIRGIESIVVDFFSIGPLSPALVMEFLPHGNLKSFLKVSQEFI